MAKSISPQKDIFSRHPSYCDSLTWSMASQLQKDVSKTHKTIFNGNSRVVKSTYFGIQPFGFRFHLCSASHHRPVPESRYHLH